VKNLLKLATVALIANAISCRYDPSRTPSSDDPDAGACVDTDATCAMPDAVPNDAVVDGPPNDAVGCTTHIECHQMTAGTCCVDPGPTGQCVPGTIIATVCVPD
jgi:hypothetical protein